jgi:hypothetical protein
MNYLDADLSIELDEYNNPEYIMLDKDGSTDPLGKMNLLGSTDPLGKLLLSNDIVDEIPQPPILVQVNTIKTTEDYILQFYFGSITIVVLLIYFRMLQKSY